MPTTGPTTRNLRATDPASLLSLSSHARGTSLAVPGAIRRARCPRMRAEPTAGTPTPVRVLDVPSGAALTHPAASSTDPAPAPRGPATDSGALGHARHPGHHNTGAGV